MSEMIKVLSDYIRSESGYTGELDPDADLLETKVLDSFSIVQLAVFVQEQFGVELEADDLTRANLASISSIVKLIERRKAT